VIAVAEREIRGAALLALVGPILERDLQRLLNGSRAVGSEQHMWTIDRNDARQCFRKLDDDAIAVAQHGGMGHAVDLIAQGLVQFGDAMAQGCDPQRRNGVQISSAVDVDQLPALGAFDDHRPIRGIAIHLSEAVPDARGVAFEPVHAVNLVYRS
jgi:hypothetical protein